MVEWGHIFRNIGLQHKIFTPYGESNAIMGRGAQYGKVKMIYHLQPKSCEDGMGIHEHHECNIV
jgi:hypothetical protein